MRNVCAAAAPATSIDPNKHAALSTRQLIISDPRVAQPEPKV